MKRLPKEDFDTMVGACDVGMIFLDHRFTIPNYPSRLLSYMSAKIPVLVSTDSNTDIGKVVVDEKFGWWCESNNSDVFKEKVFSALNENVDTVHEYVTLCNRFSTKVSYQIILKSISLAL